MIDWWIMLANALWILAGAAMLAAFGYGYWLAREDGRRVAECLRRRPFILLWASAAAVGCGGWAFGQAERWWERMLAAALAAWFAWRTVNAIRRAAPDRARRVRRVL